MAGRNTAENFRNAIISEPRVFGPQGIHTALGRVPISQQVAASAPPQLPPRPYTQTSSTMGMYGNNMFGGSYSGGAYSGYGGGMGGYGTGLYSMGGYGMGGYGRFGGGMYGSSFGMRDPMDPETRFIQLAEESSRPAFQSIESLVMAIGNIATMLDSTFFALTSSFRAILGVAANFGRLRSVFAQVWSTFALVRGITWLYRKIMYLLGINKTDPTSVDLHEAFNAAANGLSDKSSADSQNAAVKTSIWPILTFLGFIFATPYLIMKLIGQVSTTAIEESKNPKTWVNPTTSQAQYNFRASHPHELSLQAGQVLIVAPREVQQTHKLLNTGWALASIDRIQSGLVPINYIQKIAPIPNNSKILPSSLSTSMPATPLKSDIGNSIYDEQVDFVENPVVQSKINIEDDRILDFNKTNVEKICLQSKPVGSDAMQEKNTKEL